MKWFSRCLAVVAIRIDGSGACCVKGKLMQRVLGDLALIARDFDMVRGEVWVDAAGKVTFSKEIPVAAQQRIRNVLVSR